MDTQMYIILVLVGDVQFVTLDLAQVHLKRLLLADQRTFVSSGDTGATTLRMCRGSLGSMPWLLVKDILPPGGLIRLVNMSSIICGK